MNDEQKNIKQLIAENKELRQQVMKLETSAVKRSSFEQDIRQIIIESSPAFFVIIDANGKTRMMNKSMLAALGYSEEEIQGKDYLSTFVPEREHDQVSKLFGELVRGGKPTHNRNHIVSKNRRELLVEWQGHPLRNPKDDLELFCGVGLDITDHRHKEEAHRTLVESSLQALIILQDGRIVFANPAAETSTGYSSGELLEMENPFQILIHPDDLPTRLDRASRITRGETVFPQSDYRIIEKNGHVHWVDAYTTLVEWRSKPAIHVTFVDITERKQAEDEMQRISQEENKRRKELEKLREISTSMRQADRSSDLLRVFTSEVQEFCHADVTSSILFKAPQSRVVYLAPEANIELSQEQSDALNNALLSTRPDETTALIPGFESMLILPLQSAEAVHGAVLIASRERDAFTIDERNLLIAIADMAGTALHRIDILETLEERVQQRTHDLIVLYNLITIISENWNLQDILELSLMLTLETVKADRGIIYLTDGKEPPDLKPVIQRGFVNGFQIQAGSLPTDELALDVFKQRKPLALENLADSSDFDEIGGMNSYVGIPIMVRGEMRGVFSLFASEIGIFGTDKMALLTSIADHLGIGIENSILWEQSRENAALEERNRLARNLHDSVSQLLYSLLLMAGTTKKMLERDPDLDAVKNSVIRLGDTARQALKEMRLLLYELRPAVLDSEGLASALQNRIEAVEERLGMKVNLQVEELPELPSDVEDALYHIALEALNNIIKHAECTKASIKLISKKGIVVMKISDEGNGFDMNQPRKGQGLRNMRERVQMLGGEISIDSKLGQGTRITVQMKVPSSLLMGS